MFSAKQSFRLLEQQRSRSCGTTSPVPNDCSPFKNLRVDTRGLRNFVHKIWQLNLT